MNVYMCVCGEGMRECVFERVPFLRGNCVVVSTGLLGVVCLRDLRGRLGSWESCLASWELCLGSWESYLGG